MRKALLAVAVAGTLSVTFGAQAQVTPDGYQLEQVLIMSRHNLRAPLANN
ncbi:bifunctional glucose-1-phosphatase/inositol phosphatase, partial [Enterobacter hormaechei]